MRMIGSNIFSNNRINLNDIITGLIALVVGLFIMLFSGLSPFGNNSFVYYDAHYQYMDFLLYYKNILTGDDSFIYSISAGLGQSNISLFAYYLSSPFNLLLFFVPESSIHAFFNVTVFMKMALSGVTMSLFLRERLNNKLQPVIAIVLSLSYAFMNYSITQSSNIMWLDGVYMLPLILLGVSNVVKGKSISLMSISIALSIVFNWYSAGVNCIFAIIWFLFELLLHASENKEKPQFYLKRCVIGFTAGIIGLLISMPLFFPTILALKDGIGSFDWGMFNNTFRGNIVSAIADYCIGIVSNNGAPALFTGSITITGCLGCILSHNIDKRKKIVISGLLFASLIIYYWQPAFMVFSLFKDATSMWYRYSYVTSFVLVFVSACYFCTFKKRDITNWIKYSFAFILVLFALNYSNLNKDITLVYMTALFALICAMALYGYIRVPKFKRTAAVLLCLVCCLEMAYNSRVLIGGSAFNGVRESTTYNREQQKQIDAIRQKDSENYRINMTTYGSEHSNNTTAKYNESLAFGYWGVASYTSALKAEPLMFLDKTGYCNSADRKNIVNTSILPLDSLLGVKYVISPYDIKGYKKDNRYPVVHNKYCIGFQDQQLNAAADNNYRWMKHDKMVFNNPYSFPLAYCYTENEKTIDLIEYDPFNNLNKIYSKLANKEIKVFKECQVKSTTSIDDQALLLSIDGIKKDSPVYANIPSSGDANAIINVNDIYDQNYSSWLAPSVIHVPTNSAHADIHVKAEDISKFEKAQVYYCDLDEMQNISRYFNSRAQVLDVSNNQRVIKSTVRSETGKDHLVISIPKEKGWKAFVNGEKRDINVFAGCLMDLELDEGENSIVLKYTMPGQTAGVILFLIGIAMLTLFTIANKKEFFSKLWRRNEASINNSLL